MAVITNIERPLEISPRSSRKDAASEQIKHYIRANRMKPGERLPTVRKLSDHFEISRDAVWRALRQLNEEDWLELLPNKRYMVSEKVYSRILKSMRVRAVFSGNRYIYFSGFRRLADALSRECRYHNIDLQITLLPLGQKPDKEIFEACDLVLVDSDSSGRVVETFSEFPLPVIGLDANYSNRYFANIVTDHFLGGRMVAEAMVRRKARKATVVYHKGSENNVRITSRIEGFRQAWLEAGRTADSLKVVPIGWSRSSFEIALNVRKYCESIINPSGAFFVTDGRLATAFLEVFSYIGIQVPSQAQVIGYDGAQMGELTDPPMTTIQQDMERIAHTAVERISRLAGDHKEGEALERIAPLLIERGSF